MAADVWAFGTTLWEIFMYGECPPKTSDMKSVKKVQYIIFVCFSCSQVLTFWNVVKWFITYAHGYPLSYVYTDADAVMHCCVVVLPEQ